MKRSPNCAFAFSALAPVRIRTAPFSSSFFHSVSLAAQIKDFSCTFEPFSFRFSFSCSSLQQLFCCHFLELSNLGSPVRKNFIVMLHKFAPQTLIAIVWHRRRQRQTQFTSLTNALFLLLFFVIDIQTALLTRRTRSSARSLLLCSSVRFSDCLLSRKRTIASSLGGNGDSGGDRMRLKSEEAIRSFLTDDVVSSSTALFPEILL